MEALLSAALRRTYIQNTVCRVASGFRARPVAIHRVVSSFQSIPPFENAEAASFSPFENEACAPVSFTLAALAALSVDSDPGSWVLLEPETPTQED